MLTEVKESLEMIATFVLRTIPEKADYGKRLSHVSFIRNQLTEENTHDGAPRIQGLGIEDGLLCR